jgi:hypothetical protein
MKQAAKVRKTRKQRALAVLKSAPALNAIPLAGVSRVGFRAPTETERARGKAFAARAAELKRGKLAASR